ncbi:MAG: hypothetical protein KDK05_08065, partial [Candidatus Competibacteraceae bacterium]|nr:hypothetical protein [Candidatus Competibacteraceae bacterium]
MKKDGGTDTNPATASNTPNKIRECYGERNSGPSWRGLFNGWLAAGADPLRDYLVSHRYVILVPIDHQA